MALTKKEIEEFKQSLLEMRSQITKQVKGLSEDAKDFDDVKGSSQHTADADSTTQNVLLEMASQEVNLLKSIDRALIKVEEGTYGLCDVTGKPIPKARLQAIPYAVLTVEAQQMLEKGVAP